MKEEKGKERKKEGGKEVESFNALLLFRARLLDADPTLLPPIMGVR